MRDIWADITPFIPDVILFTSLGVALLFAGYVIFTDGGCEKPWKVPKAVCDYDDKGNMKSSRACPF